MVNMIVFVHKSKLKLTIIVGSLSKTLNLSSVLHSTYYFQWKQVWTDKIVIAFSYAAFPHIYFKIAYTLSPVPGTYFG